LKAANEKGRFEFEAQRMEAAKIRQGLLNVEKERSIAEMEGKLSLKKRHGGLISCPKN
jgi:hypothetical protein